ncbi:hypothetical protein [Salinispira pacifica]
MKKLVVAGLVPAVLLLAGCAAKVQSFTFTGPDNSVIALSEKPGLPREKQGLLAPGAEKGPVYRLSHPVTVAGSGIGFQLRYRGYYPGAAVMVFDGKGDPVDRAALPQSTALSSIELHLPLAAGTVVAGFQLLGPPASDGAAANTTGIQVLAAGIGSVGSAFSAPTGVGIATNAGSSPTEPSADMVSGVSFSRNGKAVSISIAHSLYGRLGLSPGRVALVLRYRYSPSSETAIPGLARVEISSGDPAQKDQSVRYELRLRPGEKEEFFYSAMLGFTPATVTVEPESSGFSLTRVDLLPGPEKGGGTSADLGSESVPSPIPADIDTILRYPEQLWRNRDFELFAWNLFPKVLIMDTRSYAVQADFFRRLSFFEEKRGYRGRVLTDSELGSMHGWNGHNYNGDGLAPFFNEAESRGVKLTSQEELLRRIALAYGLIKKGPDGYVAGEGGILSFSQESPSSNGLRSHLLTHESLHGAYYMTPEYRQAVKSYWDGMSQDERSFWKLLFGYLSYDPGFPYLMVNEFQAYLLQQPLADVRWYFRSLQVSRLLAAYPDRKPAIEDFLARYPDTFRRAASALGSALTRYTGLQPGDTRDLVPLSSGR